MFSVYGQSDNSTGQWGGVSDIFDLPVGAHAMAMGGAFVSVADDPFALYWNPSALENIPSLSLSVYHTNLPLGTQYNYLALSYPTLFVGTFSIGLLRISTPEVELYDDDASFLGTKDYGRTLYLLGYGKKVFNWLSFGTTLKIEHLIMPGYIDQGSYSESAVGADFGMLLISPVQSALMRNWQVGFNLQNTVQRAIQLEDTRELSARNFRFGLSRPLYFSEKKNCLHLAFEIDINEKKYVPRYYHFGGEFNFKNAVMLRLGYNKKGSYSDGYGLTYGAGIRQFGFQLDYSYWTGVDSYFGGGHRISISVSIGKTREQKLTEMQAEEIRRIEEQVRQQQEDERKNAIYGGQSRAERFYNDEKWAEAYSEINKVLVLDESGEDPEFANARALLDSINYQIENQREAAFTAQLERTQEEQAIRQRQQLIKEHYDKAMAFFQSEQYRSAILECDRALEYDPNDELVLDLKEMSETELRNNIVKLIERGRNLRQNNRYFDALQEFNRASNLAQGFEETQSYINGQIRELERELNYEQLIRRAVEYENNNQWSQAATLYEDALKIEPNNKELQKKYAEADARANARQMELTPEARVLYQQGYRAYRNELYDEAIQYYEQALEIQPLNRTILRALDSAREKKNKRDTNTSN